MICLVEHIKRKWKHLYQETFVALTSIVCSEQALRVFGLGSGLWCGLGFAFGNSFEAFNQLLSEQIRDWVNRLRTLGTSLGNRSTTLHPHLFNRLSQIQQTGWIKLTLASHMELISCLSFPFWGRKRPCKVNLHLHFLGGRNASQVFYRRCAW